MSTTIDTIYEFAHPNEFSAHSCGSGLDLAEPLTGVSCSVCHKPMIRRTGEPISCTLDVNGNPVCVRHGGGS